MARLQIWDKQTDLYPPVGGKLTPEQVFAQWGWAENPNVVVVIDNTGGVFGSIDNLEMLKAHHKVTTLDPIQAIQEIEDIINTPVEHEPSPEERMAAAMEFQNLMNL